MKHTLWLTLTVVLFLFNSNLLLSQPYPSCPVYSFYHTTCPLITWNFVEHATAYKVMISSDPNFSILVVNATTEKNYYQVNNLHIMDIYYVKVLPGNKQMGFGDYCTPYAFEVMSDCTIRP